MVNPCPPNSWRKDRMVALTHDQTKYHSIRILVKQHCSQESRLKKQEIPYHNSQWRAVNKYLPRKLGFLHIRDKTLISIRRNQKILHNYWLLRHWIWCDINQRIPILTEVIANSLGQYWYSLVNITSYPMPQQSIIVLLYNKTNKVNLMKYSWQKIWINNNH